jgi:hypothetical protein
MNDPGLGNAPINKKINLKFLKKPLTVALYVSFFIFAYWFDKEQNMDTIDSLAKEQLSQYLDIDIRHIGEPFTIREFSEDEIVSLNDLGLIDDIEAYSMKYKVNNEIHEVYVEKYTYDYVTWSYNFSVDGESLVKK